MKRTANMRITTNDRLVIAWWDCEKRKLYRQGKRISALCPLPLKFCRIYAKEGSIKVVRALMDEYKFSISQAKSLLDEARYGKY